MMNTVRIQEQMGLRLVRANMEKKGKAASSSTAELLAQRLCSATGCSKALLAPTAAGAMAQAIALARAYGAAKHGPKCTGILVLTHREFDLWLVNAEGFSLSKPMDPDSLKEKLDGTICAVVFSFWEPGEKPLPTAYVKELFYLCRSAGVLLISDETALGLGRTGTLLAGEGYGKKTDLTVVTLGHFMGACLVRGGLEAEPGADMPEVPACAEALAALDALLVPGALAAIGDTGIYFQKALKAIPGLTQVWGLGLALSAAVEREASLRLAGISLPGLTLTARENGVILSPDLTVGKGELAQCLALLRRILSEQ